MVSGLRAIKHTTPTLMTFSALSAVLSFTELSILPVGITPADSKLNEGIGSSPAPIVPSSDGEPALECLPAGFLVADGWELELGCLPADV